MTVERMPPLPPADYTEAQKKAAAQFAEIRGTPVFGPFVPLLRSPELMARVQAVGEYLRFRSPVDAKLREFAILIMAREWSQDYEWYVHHPLALKAGLKPEIADAVREGRRPRGMDTPEETLHDFVVELNRTKRVSDETYSHAVAHFGEQGVIDIVAIQGFYTLIAITLNVARVTLPSDGKPMPRIPD